MKVNDLAIEVRLSTQSADAIDSLINHIADAVIDRVKKHLQEDAESLVAPVLDQVQTRLDNFLLLRQRSVARDVPDSR